ncbi:MAG: uracil permease [Bacillota bacterium]|nr:MAG: uracil permease [Bacillota bacterium]MBS3949667.1 NCS2 family nucleobase:cation symporter [Peptococcaceae bacterium]
MSKSYDPIPWSKLIPLGLQHVFAMFGATILVPVLTGLDPRTALFTSAVGTLLFLIITKGMVPAYLGSSFAFIVPIQIATASYGVNGALFGCFVAGLVYVAISAIIKSVGIGFVEKYFPPIVVGPVIMTIGLGLASVASDMSNVNITVAMVTLGVTILVSYYGKGLFKIIPILMGITGGYLFSLALHFTGRAELFNFADLKAASWMPAFPDYLMLLFTEPSATVLNPSNWALGAVLIVAPVAAVTVIEHLGDILTISRTTGRDFLTEPGLHRTILGDGLATSMAALFGGPPNTTYGENVGVLAITKVFNPIVVKVAAVFVLVFSVIPKVGAAIGTIPAPVMGGVVVLLFGMIASVGIRTLVEKRVDLSDTRNLVIASTIIILGISGLKFAGLQGMGLGAIVGLLLNVLLPEKTPHKDSHELPALKYKEAPRYDD